MSKKIIDNLNGWFYESAAKKDNLRYENTPSSFQAIPTNLNNETFESNFKLIREHFLNQGIDIQKDFTAMINNQGLMNQYKNKLMKPIVEAFSNASPNDPHIASIIETVNQLWDTKVRSYTESATMASFLPIATLEFPVLVKQFFQTILKDIIEVEAVKTPRISRQICTRYLVDNQTGEEYEYPKCMFNGDWQKIWNAAKGPQVYHKLYLPQHHYDLVAGIKRAHTDPVTGVIEEGYDFHPTVRLSFQLMIPEVVIETGAQEQVRDATTGEVVLNDQGQPVVRNQEVIVPLPGNGIRIELATGGTFLNGDLDFVAKVPVVTDAATGATEDKKMRIFTTIGGMVDYHKGLIDIASSNSPAGAMPQADEDAGEVQQAKVVGVVFKGYLSNEGNIKSVSVREKRSIIRFEIEDGARWVMPFSIEEIEDAAALLDLNYYNRMVDQIVLTQEQIETMSVIKFLLDEYEKFEGVETDIYKLESIAMTYRIDLQPPAGFAGDPFKYISSVIQFRLKAIFQEITNKVKLDNLSFIIVGNPMACQPITQFVDWKCQQGTSIGGITVNGSYGFVTDMGANIRIVASNLYDPYTKGDVTFTNQAGQQVTQRELVLHIYAYPTSPDHISYRHLKYTSHLLTSQSQTAYTMPSRSTGGAYNIVTAVSRYHTFAVQGIQARVILLNSDRIYGLADPNARDGAPWTDLINADQPEQLPFLGN